MTRAPGTRSFIDKDGDWPMPGSKIGHAGVQTSTLPSSETGFCSLVIGAEQHFVVSGTEGIMVKAVPFPAFRLIDHRHRDHRAVDRQPSFAIAARRAFNPGASTRSPTGAKRFRQS